MQTHHVLAVEQLLCHNRGQTAEHVPPGIDHHRLQHHIAQEQLLTSSFKTTPADGDSDSPSAWWITDSSRDQAPSFLAKVGRRVSVQVAAREGKPKLRCRRQRGFHQLVPSQTFFSSGPGCHRDGQAKEPVMEADCRRPAVLWCHRDMV